MADRPDNTFFGRTRINDVVNTRHYQEDGWGEIDRDTRRYNWDASRRDEFTPSRREVTDDWSRGDTFGFGGTRVDENPYGHHALGVTRPTPLARRPVSSNEDAEDIPYRPSMRDNRNTRPRDQTTDLGKSRRPDNLRETMTQPNLGKSSRDMGDPRGNGGLSPPYRPNGLGNTRQENMYAQSSKLRKTETDQNPYGHGALGMTRPGTLLPPPTDDDTSSYHATTIDNRDESSRRHERPKRKKKKKKLRETRTASANDGYRRDSDDVTDPHYKRYKDRSSFLSTGWQTFAIRNNWPEIFSQMSPRMDLANHDKSFTTNQSSYSDDSSDSDYTDSTGPRCWNLSTCHISKRGFIGIGIALGIVLVLGILIPIIVLVSKNPDTPDSYRQYNMSATLTNRQYDVALGDKNSDAYRQLSQEFCNSVDTQADRTSGYRGCLVNGFSNGSVIVSFVVVISTRNPGNTMSVEEISVTIGVTQTGGTNNIGAFVVTTVVILNTEIVTEEILPQIDPTRRKTIGGRCTDATECSTVLSRCIAQTCACPTGRVHNTTEDSCQTIRCGPHPSNENANITGDGQTFGSNLTITCHDGYIISDNVTMETVQCITHGTWGTLSTCKPKPCLEYTVPGHAVITAGNTSGRVYQDEIVYTCKLGYELETGDNASASCLADGNWTSSPSCKPINCSRYLNTANRIADTDTGVFMDTIIISCDDGFEHENRSIVMEECQANKTWTDHVKCVPKPCLEYTVPDNATVTAGNTSGSVYQDEIVYACNLGYELENGNNASVSCLSDGSWSGDTPCRPVECSPYVTDAQTIAVITTGVYLDTINISCSAGFKHKNNLVTKELCQANKTWTKRVTCIRKTCSEFTAPPNSKIDSGNVTHSVYEDIIRLTCEDGYESTSTDSMEVQCQADQSWTQSTFTCSRIHCPELTPPENSITNQTSVTRYGDIVKITCVPGYNLNGEENAICQSNKTLSVAGSCDPISCSEYNPPGNSNISTSVTGKLYGEEIIVACLDGFLLVGSSNVACYANGSWPDRRCEEISCGEPGILNGFVADSSSTSVEIQCDIGYFLNGNAVIICENNTWGNKPTCNIYNCGSYGPVDNGVVSNVNGTTFGKVATVRCHEGFKFANTNEDGIVSCNATGHWDREIECKQIDCGAYTTPDHATTEPQIVNETIFNTSITISCDEGYTLIGNTSVVCLDSEEWTVSPECSIVDCEDPPDIANASYTLPTETTFNKSFDVTCTPGYETNDETKVVCQSSGIWSSIPQCTRVSCSNLSPPENGAFTSNLETISGKYGDSVEFLCKAGFELIGSSNAICQSNMTWSPSPECRLKDCGNSAFGKFANGSVSYDNTTFRSVATIRCNEGFALIGTENVTCLESGEWEVLPVCNKVDCGRFDTPPNAEIRNFTIVCKVGYVLEGNSELECQSNGTWSNLGICKPVECSRPTALENGNFNLSQSNTLYVYKNVLTVECNEGFSSDIPIIKCESDGNWTDIPECSRILCGQFDVPLNATIENGISDNRVYEDTLNVTCGAGFLTNTGSQQQVVTCNASGEWSPVVFCERRLCPNIMPLQNSNIGDQNPENRRFQDVINITCNAGYQYPDGTFSEIISCGDKGDWSERKTCVKRTCPNLQQPPFTYIVNGSLDGNVFENEVEVKCIEGYSSNTNNSVSYICNEDGEWNGSITCLPLSCVTFPQIRNSTHEPTDDLVYGMNVTITCASGYIIFGDAIVSCDANGDWEVLTFPLCVKCEEYEVNNGSVNYNGKVSNVECNNGFTLNGSSEVLCEKSGSFVGIPTCNLVDCQTPQLENGSVILTNNVSTFGSNASAECNIGYNQTEPLEISCTANGSWSGHLSCNIVDCNGYQTPPHVVHDTSDTTYNSTIDVSCDTGYQFQNGSDNFVRCGKGGRWIGNPMCEGVVCEEITLPANSQLQNDTKSVYRYMDRIKIDCDEGYTLSGNSTVICQYNKTWTEYPVCNQVYCNPPNIPTGSILSPNKSEYSYNETININCPDGYELNTTSAFRCTRDGSWDNIDMECKPISCGAFPIPQNANITGNSTSFESVVTVTCMSGYHLNGNKTSECQASRNWSEIGACEPVDCSEYPVLENGTVTGTVTEFEAIAYVECDTGYRLNGVDFTTCLATGNWSQTGRCEIISCETITTPENSFINTSNYETSYQSSVTILCNNGYGYKDKNETDMICSENGTWIGNVNCVPVKCSLPQLPANMTLVNNTAMTTMFHFESVLQVACEAGFGLVGDEYITCQADSTWSNISTCSELSCGNINISDASVLYSATGNATVSCDDRFTLVGDSVVYCQFNGSWTQTPSCNLTNCGPLAVNNQTTLNTTNDRIGTNVHVQCINGYMLNGSESVTCNSDGYWSETIACVIVDCKNAPIVQNGNIVVNSSVFEAVGMVNCDQGYTLEGPNTTSCQASGNWSVTGICNPIECGNITTPGNSYTESNTYPTSYQSSVTILCNNGYEYKNDNETSLICSENGTWIGNVSCMVVQCSLPQLPANMTLVNKTAMATMFHFETVLQVACETGYWLVGDEYITCQADSTWSNFPNCTELSCGNINISDASVLYSATGNATISCDDRFTLVGDSVVYCQFNGSWTQTPSCNLTNCGPLAVNNQTTLNTTNDRIGTKVHVQCINGYMLNGSESVTCNSDGYWSTTTTCVIVNCNMAPVVLNGNIVVDSTVFESVANLTCNTGYRVNGTYTTTCQASGNWSDIGTCYPLDCGQIELQDTMYVLPFIYQTIYNSSVTIPCNVGYEYKDANETDLLCSENATWIGDVSCVPVQCVQTEIPANMTIVNNTISTSFDYGTVLHVECVMGYSLIGNEYITCQANKTWGNMPNCTESPCPHVEIANATVEYSGLNNATITCDERFELIGDPVIYCLANGSWTVNPTCNITSCGILDSVNFSLPLNSSDISVGAVVKIECQEGYNMSGSAVVTCNPDGYWSELPTCKLVDCGQYNDTERFTLESGMTTFNTTRRATCRRGLTPVIRSDMLISCNASGDWNGNPQCNMTGTPSFDMQTNVFEIGSEQTLTCKIENAVDWGTILFGLQSDVLGRVEIYQVTNDNNVLTNITNSAYDVTMVINGNTINIHVNIKSVQCSAGGSFMCGLLAGEDITDPIESRFTNTIVNLTANSSNPVLSAPDLAYAGREVVIECSGDVGRSVGQRFGSLSLYYKNETSSVFSLLSDDASINCNGTAQLASAMTLITNTTVRCNLTTPDGETFIQDQSVVVSQSYIAFSKSSYAFIIGENNNFTCDIANIPGWEEIVVKRNEDNTTILRRTNGSVTEIPVQDISLSNSSEFADIYARVIVEFDNVACSMETHTYTCSVRAGSDWNQDVTSVVYQKQPSTPVLTLSREIIDNKFTLGDRPFICEAELGMPPGTLEIQSTFTGDWAPFLTFDNLGKNNSIGFIFKNESSSDNCTNVLKLYFAFHKATLDLQLESLRCVVTASSGVVGGRTINSEEGVIKVLEETFCQGKAQGRYRHPYHCNLAVLCKNDGTINGVPEPCSDGMCANSVTCEECDSCDTLEPTIQYLRCSESEYTGIEGQPLTITCELHARITEVTSISINLESGLMFSTTESNHSNPLTIPDFNAVVTSTNKNLTINFSNLLCAYEGRFTVAINNSTESETVLIVQGSVHAPQIVNMSEPSNGQEMSITCTATVGERNESPSILPYLQVQKKEDMEFSDVSQSVEPLSTTCTPCSCNVTMVFRVMIDTTWNDSNIRCAVDNGTSVLLSEERNIIASEGALRFINPVDSVHFNDTYKLMCELTENVWTPGVVVSRENNTEQQNLCAYNMTNGMTCYMPGFTANYNVTGTTLTIVIEKEQFDCDDAGKYVCFLSNSTSSRASTVVSIIKPPEVPDITLSRQIINGQGTWADRPFFCSGNIGYPHGEMIVERSDDGTTFSSYLTLSNPSNGTAKILDGSVENDDSGCGRKQTFKFAFRDVTLDLHNVVLRCSIIPAQEQNDLNIVPSANGVIKVIENTLCEGVNKSHLGHPYHCNLYIVCTSPTIAGVRQCDNQDECFDENVGHGACQSCENVECPGSLTTTTAAPASTTTTNLLDERIICPNTINGSVGSQVTANCSVLNVNTINYIRLMTTSGVTIFDATDANGLSGQLNTNADVTVLIGQNNDYIEIIFPALSCANEDTYTITINNGTLSSVNLAVTSNPGNVDLSMTPTPRLDQILELTCQGNVGRNEDGAAKSQVQLQVKFKDADNFVVYTNGLISGIPGAQCFNENCVCNQSLTYSVTTDSGWDQAIVRCVLNSVNGILDVTNITTLTLGQTQVAFVTSNTEATIGQSHSFVCRITDDVMTNGAFIAKSTNGLQQTLCSISSSLMKENCSSGFDITGQENGTNKDITFNIANVTCDDRGTYLCIPRSNPSTRASMALSVKALPRILSFKLPIQLIENSRTPWNRDYLESNVDLGYPEADTRVAKIEYKLTGNEFVPFDLESNTVNEAPSQGNCEYNKTLRHENVWFPDHFNNSRFRCSIYENSTSTQPLVSSEELPVFLVSASLCPPDIGDIYFEHPYNCQRYVRCVSGTPHVNTCYPNCAEVVNGTLTCGICDGRC